MTSKPAAAQDLEASTPDIAALSTALISAVNARDWDLTNGLASQFAQHLAPGFKSHSDITSQQGDLLSFAGQVAVWKERGLQHPQAHFEIIQVDTNFVDEDEASVVTSMRVHGVDDVVLHAMNEFKWCRTSDGSWQCTRLIGFRGSFGNTGTI